MKHVRGPQPFSDLRAKGKRLLGGGLTTVVDSASSACPSLSSRGIPWRKAAVVGAETMQLQVSKHLQLCCGSR